MRLCDFCWPVATVATKFANISRHKILVIPDQWEYWIGCVLLLVCVISPYPSMRLQPIRRWEITHSIKLPSFLINLILTTFCIHIISSHINSLYLTYIAMLPTHTIILMHTPPFSLTQTVILSLSLLFSLTRCICNPAYAHNNPLLYTTSIFLLQTSALTFIKIEGETVYVGEYDCVWGRV